MAKVDKFQMELEYLSEYVNDVLRELALHITWDGPCDDFEARSNGVGCLHCAYEKLKH